MSLTVPVSEIVEKSSNPLLQIHPAWERIPLGDIAEILNGFAFESIKFNNEKGIPLLRIRDIGKNNTDSFYEGPYDPTYIVELGDFLIGMDGDFNCGRWKGPKALLNQRVCKVTVVSKYYEPTFLDFVLPGYLKAINEKTSSVTVKHLSSKSIAEIPIPLPPLPEQRRIVTKIEELFTKLDAGVSELKKTQAQLKRYRQSVLKAACEGKLVPTEAELAKAEGREYEGADVLLARILKELREKSGKGAKYKEPVAPETSGLMELPEGWKWANVGMISEKIQYGTSEKAGEDNSGIPVIRMGNIQDGKLTLENLKYFPKEWSEISDYLLQDGDVLFNRTNSAELVGKTSVYKNQHPSAVFASYLIRVKVIKNAYNPDLLSFFINSLYGRKYVGSVVSQQVGQANVNGTKLS